MNLLVAAAGPFSTVQDEGRRGLQRFGVSVAGAFDAWAMAAANALVGNPPGAAVIESTVMGDCYEAQGGDMRVALAGHAALAIDGTPAAPWRSHTLRAGQRLKVGAFNPGLRGYLAVAGGFALAPELGSVATHVRNGLGGLAGARLRDGDRLPLAATAPPQGPELALAPPAPPPPELRVVLGPQDDYFDAAAIATFLGAEYRLTSEADRLGCRLDGPAVAARRGHNIVSDGVPLGAVQIPGSGLPIIVGPDRQTTGGYPKIACVIRPDIGRLAQFRPGQALRFRAVGIEEATRLYRAFRRDMAGLASQARPAADGAGLDAARLLSLNLIGGAVDALANRETGQP